MGLLRKHTKWNAWLTLTPLNGGLSVLLVKFMISILSHHYMSNKNYVNS